MGWYDDIYRDRIMNSQDKDYIDTALICENGHIINDSMKEYPENNSSFCKECGAKAISACIKCGKPIDGKHHVEGFIDCTSISLPKYCKYCGNPYPWTEKKIESVTELVDLMDELTSDEKKELKETVPMISTNNPKTTVGVLKIKKYLGKTGKTIAQAAQKVIVDVASETAIKVMKEQGML